MYIAVQFMAKFIKITRTMKMQYANDINKQTANLETVTGNPYLLLHQFWEDVLR
jgi:hypothetical protein